jgi:hypothetical protein
MTDRELLAQQIAAAGFPQLAKLIREGSDDIPVGEKAALRAMGRLREHLAWLWSTGQSIETTTSRVYQDDDRYDFLKPKG